MNLRTIVRVVVVTGCLFFWLETQNANAAECKEGETPYEDGGRTWCCTPSKFGGVNCHLPGQDKPNGSCSRVNECHAHVSLSLWDKTCMGDSCAGEMTLTAESAFRLIGYYSCKSGQWKYIGGKGISNSYECSFIERSCEFPGCPNIKSSVLYPILKPLTFSYADGKDCSGKTLKKPSFTEDSRYSLFEFDSTPSSAEEFEVQERNLSLEELIERAVADGASEEELSACVEITVRE